MDKLGPALRRIAEFLCWQPVDASAAAVSRLEDGHSFACACQLAGSHEACSAGADHDEMRQMLRGSRHHKTSLESRLMHQGICVPSAATAF